MSPIGRTFGRRYGADRVQLARTGCGAASSERLYAAIVERRLRHPDDPALNAHGAAAVTKDTPRGWRLDKAGRSAQIDAIVALAMALEAADAADQIPTEPLVAWLAR